MVIRLFSNEYQWEVSMPVNESYAIVAFRSRQHALHFNRLLSSQGLITHIMTTPREVAMGCGLSVKFSPQITSKVIQAYREYNMPIIGFFQVRKEGGTMRFVKIPH
jgi:2-keto-3-deoxy-6-phosphogluconate aldolase